MRFICCIAVALATGCAPVDGEEPPPAPTPPDPRLFTVTNTHLGTRVAVPGSMGFRLADTREGLPVDAWVAQAMAHLRATRANGADVPVTVAPTDDQHGKGLHVTWTALPSEGWYALSFPLGGLPLTPSRSYETTADGRARFWFRVGSQPTLKRVVRCGKELAFEFSEPVGTEARFLSDVLDVRQAGVRVDCEPIAGFGATQPQDLTVGFTQLTARCRQAGAVQTYALSRLATREGLPVHRVDGSATTMTIDWGADVEREGQQCSSWYEPRLPTP